MRAEQLGVEFILQGRKEKILALQEIIAVTGLCADEIAFIGDDTPDAEVMRLVGLAVAVSDALEEVKTAAHYVTSQMGGRGAVRELIDLMLTHKPFENLPD